MNTHTHAHNDCPAHIGSSSTHILCCFHAHTLEYHKKWTCSQLRGEDRPTPLTPPWLQASTIRWDFGEPDMFQTRSPTTNKSWLHESRVNMQVQQLWHAGNILRLFELARAPKLLAIRPSINLIVHSIEPRPFHCKTHQKQSYEIWTLGATTTTGSCHQCMWRHYRSRRHTCTAIYTELKGTFRCPWDTPLATQPPHLATFSIPCILLCLWKCCYAKHALLSHTRGTWFTVHFK